ncbi:CBO0543 family protein [Priestia aryabhattai]|uniref:CBO0543 family protein n=1 Tax=Priestia aryabhattai TaxID=412384 RepID=UPI0028708DB4|nr:CBO0543 family protein [Priestia aryabhattai]
MFIQNKKIILNFTRYKLELFSINFIFPTHFYISNRQNIAIFSSFLDMIGDFLGLWDYRYEVFPLTSNYLPWDLFLLPISMMFFIQVKPKIKPVIKALIYSAVASFIGLPLLNWIGVYKQLHWRYIYSFPILVVIYIAASYIASKRKFEKL